MTESNPATPDLSKLFAACWRDDALKSRFLADPRAVLREHGIEVPDQIEVRVTEARDDVLHITLPQPPAGHADLSDDDLAAAAGGSMTSQARQFMRQQMGYGS